VEVCAADAGVENANLDIVDANFRLGNVLEPEAALVTTFYKCLHGEYLSAFACGAVRAEDVHADHG
jgi:hypothetical protein